MNPQLAQHIAQFTGHAKFRERKFHKYLRRTRKAAKRKPDNNKQLAIDQAGRIA